MVEGHQINKHITGIMITTIHADRSFGNGNGQVGNPKKFSLKSVNAEYLKDG